MTNTQEILKNKLEELKKEMDKLSIEFIKKYSIEEETSFEDLFWELAKHNKSRYLKLYENRENIRLYMILSYCIDNKINLNYNDLYMIASDPRKEESSPSELLFYIEDLNDFLNQ